jgi:lysozyme
VSAISACAPSARAFAFPLFSYLSNRKERRMTRRISDAGFAKLQQWEGFVPYAYDDADGSYPRKRLTSRAGVKGTITIGYGHTRTAAQFIGREITEAEGAELLRSDLAPVEAAIEKAITVPLNDRQHAVLCSFAFNLGASLDPGAPLANIAETLNTGDYGGALARMGLYNKTRVNGRLVLSNGLVNRRSLEAGYWAAGESTVAATPPATKPEESAAAKHGPGLGIGALGGGALASAAEKLGDADWKVVAVLAVAALIAGAVWFFYLRSPMRTQVAERPE